MFRCRNSVSRDKNLVISLVKNQPGQFADRAGLTPLSDMAPSEWQQMICVETTNAADNAHSCRRGAAHEMTATIRVE